MTCPMLEKCEDKVDKLHAEHICRDNWEACEHTQPLAVKKKPREWKFQE